MQIQINQLNRLPNNRRNAAAELKYAEAVQLYATSDLTIRKVAELCGVTAIGLSTHIGKYYRALLFARYGLGDMSVSLDTIKIRPRKGQSIASHLKYKDAIEACGDLAYIEFNVSQVARLFKLDGSGLAAQLRVHYPEIVENRETLRKRLGIADNIHRGARKCCAEAYSEALAIYRDTDLTITEVADVCNVSKSGLCQFMRYYHKDIMDHKAARREAAVRKPGFRRVGALSGNGNLYGPRAGTVERYAAALELYRTSSMTVDEIAERSGVCAAGFKGYLHQWHRGEKLRRRGIEWDGESEVSLRDTPHYLKSTAAKYAAAVESIKAAPRAVADVAREFGHDPDIFRIYLKKHEPELMKQLGMTHLASGKLVRRSSAAKYESAIREYATSTDTLKSIAQRHNLVYKSLFNYMKRNCPEERASHDKLLETSRNN